MEKQTIRYEESVLDEAEKLYEGEGTVFESRSKFFRFAAEYVLSGFNEEYEPTDEFEDRIEELDDIEGAEELVVAVTDPYFKAYDYASSIVRTLEDESVSAEERVEKVLDRTYDFINSEFPKSYLAEDIE